jgi:hypothetical protein
MDARVFTTPRISAKLILKNRGSRFLNKKTKEVEKMGKAECRIKLNLLDDLFEVIYQDSSRLGR